MSQKFPEYESLLLAGINQKVLHQRQEEDLFARSLALREGAPSFVFYEGPPSANGMPGIHHVMARSIKDIFCRYKTMKGFRVDRKAGWDTHGLPVELGVEKALGITKEDIGKKISVDEYNAACRREVMKYTQEWEQLTRLMGYWVDMDHPYITYDNRYIETLWYLLSEIYKKGLLYKGYTIQPYSPAAGTGLSTHELNQPGCYRDVKDTTCVAQFRIIDPRAELTGHGEAVFLAWTTTPWTLPSNTALCVGPEIDYVAVRSFNPYSGAPITAVVARALLHTLFSKEHEGEEALAAYQPGDKKLPYVIVGEWKGKDLVGTRYEQLLPWMRPDGDAFRVIAGDFVTTSDGTGIVHIAPTFGADDNKVAKASDIAGLTVLDRDGNVRPMVDMQGRLFRLEDMDPAFVKDFVNVDIYKEFAGRYVKNAYDDTLTDQDETLDVTIALLLHGGGGGAPVEKVRQAAEVAHADEFINEMPAGYDTNIGDRGGKLSGGQRQRLSIARAVYKNPPILILDEATSALDTKSERLVQSALDHLMEGRTTIVIAHRLSTIIHADVICVVDDGRIVEQGTHDELLALGGHYAKLHAIQVKS